MSVGVYGIVRPSDVSIGDIDVYYNFTPSRDVENNEIIKLNSGDLLTECFLPEDDDTTLVGGDNILEGLYNLTLPATIFNQIGIYTIYLKPKSFLSTIVDCNVLSSQPTIKGIVLDVSSGEIPSNLVSSNALQGYRVEYYDGNNNKVRNLVRFIVTSNKVVPVNENVGNTNQTTTKYRFDETGNLLFLQLTPSSSNEVKPNQLPFIGNPGGVVRISNTFFNPIVLEVELVENTIDSLMDIVGGEQIKDVRNGILTYYDKDRVIKKQFNLFEIKDETTDVPLYEVKERRDNLDETQNFDDIISELENS